MRYYDALHRITDVGNNNQALSHCKRFRYDNSSGYPGSTKPAGLTYTLGRLIEAVTDRCDNTGDAILTDEWFSYTTRGEVSDVYQSTPNSGAYYHTNLTYWPSGLPNQLGNNIASLPAFSYSPDSEGRPYQVSASSGQNPVTGVTYNTGSLPTQVNFGSGDYDIFSYDSNTLRMTQFKFNVGTQSQYLNGALTWNTNGTLGQLAITDQFNSANTQTCNYSHDDLIRIANANCGGAAAQTFSFDPFGNINKSGSPYTFNAFYSASTNHITCIGGSGQNCTGGVIPTYDSNGNVTNDGLHTYSWDAYGNSITVDTVTLIFDALDRMVEQNRSGSYSQIVYGPTGNKLALMNGQTLSKAFVQLPGRATAVYTSNGLDHYKHSDWLGSSRLTSSASRTYLSSIAYAPYGETYASSGATDPAFTGQNPDTVSTDYDFLHREYSIQGRWPSPDPAGLAAANPTNPQSWNRYAYVLNNPTEYTDASGLCPLIVAGFKDSPENSPDLLTYARQIGADVAFPYAGQGVVADVGSVVAQDLGAVNAAVQTTEAALQDAGSASQNEGGGNAVNIITFSGGAQAASSAINDLGNVDLTSAVYLEPGTGLITGLITGLPQGANQSAIVRGKGFLNGFLNLFTRSHGIPVAHTDCGHSASCVFNQLSAVTPQNTDPCSNPQIFAPGRAPQPLFPGGGGGGGGGGCGFSPPTFVPIFLTGSDGEGGSFSYFAFWLYTPGTLGRPTY